MSAPVWSLDNFNAIRRDGRRVIAALPCTLEPDVEFRTTLARVVDLLNAADDGQARSSTRPGEHAGCENCRKTERTLARALGVIERLIGAERALSAARSNARDAELVANERRAEAAKWLEEL